MQDAPKKLVADFYIFSPVRLLSKLLAERLNEIGTYDEVCSNYYNAIKDILSFLVENKQNQLVRELIDTCVGFWVRQYYPKIEESLYSYLHIKPEQK